MLKRYELRSNRETHEGWAIIVIDTDIGFFATVSDYGNYAYVWRAPGCEFRKFLIGVEPDYLLGKLLHGRMDRLRVFDGDGTKKEILKYIDENMVEECRSQNLEKYENEKEVLARRSFDCQQDFEAWQSETLLDEPWHFGCWVPDPQCVGFCTKIMPRFKKLLEEELKAEG